MIFKMVSHRFSIYDVGCELVVNAVHVLNYCIPLYGPVCCH